MNNDYPAGSSYVQPSGALWIMLLLTVSRPVSAAEVVVVSTEDTISVWWDGQRVGSTPLELGAVQPGTHNVEFGDLLDEDTIFGQNVQVQQGVDLRVTVDFERRQVLVTESFGLRPLDMDPAPEPKLQRHPWPWLVGAGGVASLGLGTATWVQSRSWEAQAEANPNPSISARIREVEVRPRQQAAIIEGAAGAALLAGAGVLWGRAARQVGIGPQGVWMRGEF